MRRRSIVLIAAEQSGEEFCYRFAALLLRQPDNFCVALKVKFVFHRNLLLVRAAGLYTILVSKSYVSISESCSYCMSRFHKYQGVSR